MMSYLLLFLAFSLAERDHVVSGSRVPRAFDANSCLKTHLENQFHFSLYVICKHSLVTNFCQLHNLVGQESWYTPPNFKVTQSHF